MKKTVCLATAMALLFLAASHVFAAAPEWKIDPAHSGIYFRVKHIYSAVSGFFPEFDATIRFDPANLDQSRFAFKVEVKSINTHNGKRDNHLLSGDFFDAKQYPEMTFESKAITHAGGDQYTVEGLMTVKDVTQPVKLPFTFFGTTQHPFNPKLQVAGFEARMSIDRLAYHVGNGKFFKMGVVGKEVDVLISLEVTREK